MEKSNSSKKELMMIVVVVILAFGLTVTGVIYLTSSLFGTKEAPKVAQQSTDDENIVRFVLDDELENTEPAPTPVTNDLAIPAPENTAPVAVAPTPAPVTPAPIPAPVAKPTTAPTPTAAPAAKPTVAAKPATTKPVPTKPAGSGKYIVQVGAFKSEASAMSEAQKLSKDYPDVFVMKVDLGSEGIWYRVRCCSTNSKEAADKLKAEIEAKYSIKPIVQAQ